MIRRSSEHHARGMESYGRAEDCGGMGGREGSGDEPGGRGEQTQKNPCTSPPPPASVLFVSRPHR